MYLCFKGFKTFERCASFLFRERGGTFPPSFDCSTYVQRRSLFGKNKTLFEALLQKKSTEKHLLYAPEWVECEEGK